MNEGTKAIIKDISREIAENQYMAIDWIHTIFTGGRYIPDPSLVALVLGSVAAKAAQKPFEEKPSGGQKNANQS